MLLNTKKTFGDIHLDDVIYILNPKGPTLQSARIKQITPAKLLGYVIITYFIPHPQADLLPDNHPSKPCAALMLKKADSFVIAATLPPVPIATTKEEILAWAKS